MAYENDKGLRLLVITLVNSIKVAIIETRRKRYKDHSVTTRC